MAYGGVRWGSAIGVVSCVVQCCALPCRAVSCRSAPRCIVMYYLCSAVLFSPLLSHAVQYDYLLCCVALRCAVRYWRCMRNVMSRDVTSSEDIWRDEDVCNPLITIHVRRCNSYMVECHLIIGRVYNTPLKTWKLHIWGTYSETTTTKACNTSREHWTKHNIIHPPSQDQIAIKTISYWLTPWITWHDTWWLP